MDQTLTWLQTLPTDGVGGSAMSERVLSLLLQAHRDGSSTPEQMAQTWQSVGQCGWTQLRQLEELLSHCLSGGEALMQQLNGPATRPLLQSQFLRWSQANSDEVGNWLNANAASPLYDTAATGLVQALASNDQTAAQTWALTIHDPVLRSQALARVGVK
jgi:hypothetical protein